MWKQKQQHRVIASRIGRLIIGRSRHPRVSVQRRTYAFASSSSRESENEPVSSRKEYKNYLVNLGKELNQNADAPCVNKTSITVDVMIDAPGALDDIIDCFRTHNVNMTSIESKLKSFAREGPAFNIDFEGSLTSSTVQEMLCDLQMLNARLSINRPREVDWFPMNIRDLDLTRETLDGGTDLINEDHPGFNDASYRKRRESIIRNAHEYRHGTPIPRVEYTEDETKTWGVVYERIMANAEKYACREFLEAIPLMEKNCGYDVNNIPQLEDISNYLQQTTGFTLRPVSGLLSARDFLNALAFRVFFSTQYIRHHGNPLYTPEPDICHELMGHVPMFSNRSFADFSQRIGLASLAASDEDVDRLASIYWFTVEFGVCKEEDEIKAYGAGLLSSFGEMEWSCAEKPSMECRESGGMMADYPDLEKPNILPFDANAMAKQPFPITTYQPTLFVANNLEDAKIKTSEFCDSLHRPFFPQYDPLTQNIVTSKAVTRLPRTSTVELQAKKQKEYFEAIRQPVSE